MKIKKGDTVMVIAGKDKGKSGKVLKAMPKENKVVVEGVNVQTKHAKATQKTPAEIKHIEGPIDASNVMYFDKRPTLLRGSVTPPTRTARRSESPRRAAQ